MKLRRAAAAAACLTALAIPAAASAAEPPPGAIKNMEFVKNLDGAKQITAINFLTYGRGSKQRTVMLTTGRFGVGFEQTRCERLRPPHPGAIDQQLRDRPIGP